MVYVYMWYNIWYIYTYIHIYVVYILYISYIYWLLVWNISINSSIYLDFYVIPTNSYIFQSGRLNHQPGGDDRMIPLGPQYGVIASRFSGVVVRPGLQPICPSDLHRRSASDAFGMIPSLRMGKSPLPVTDMIIIDQHVPTVLIHTPS